MCDARKANDTAKLESLKAKAAADRATMKQLHQAERQRIAAILTPEQKAKFEAMKAEGHGKRGMGRHGAMRGHGGKGRGHGPAGMRRMAEELNLTDAQKTQIEAIHQSA